MPSCMLWEKMVLCHRPPPRKPTALRPSNCVCNCCSKVSCELGSIETTEPTGGTQKGEYWGGPTNGQAAACRRRLRRLEEVPTRPKGRWLAPSVHHISAISSSDFSTLPQRGIFGHSQSPGHVSSIFSFDFLSGPPPSNPSLPLHCNYLRRCHHISSAHFLLLKAAVLVVADGDGQAVGRLHFQPG